MESLRCVQINLQKSKVASVELCIPNWGDVALVQEPYVYGSRLRFLDTVKGTVLAAKGKPRAAIYVRRDLETWLVEELSTEDLCVCTMKIEGRIWYLASLYLDINHSISGNDDVNRLLEWCDNYSISLLIGADSNAHSPLWGCSNSNARGEELEELILTNHLAVMNVGNVYIPND